MLVFLDLLWSELGKKRVQMSSSIFHGHNNKNSHHQILGRRAYFFERVGSTAMPFYKTDERLEYKRGTRIFLGRITMLHSKVYCKALEEAQARCNWTPLVVWSFFFQAKAYPVLQASQHQ